MFQVVLHDGLPPAVQDSLDPIPPALLDRLELIEFPGYVEEEKVMIARQFLIPRQLKQHGLTEIGLKFDDKAISTLIREYTYEASIGHTQSLAKMVWSM